MTAADRLSDADADANKERLSSAARSARAQRRSGLALRLGESLRWNDSWLATAGSKGERTVIDDKFPLRGLTYEQVLEAAVELCARGLITCTHGSPGDPDATYAFAWLPLDDEQRYAPDVRALHCRNMAALAAMIIAQP